MNLGFTVRCATALLAAFFLLALSADVQAQRGRGDRGDRGEGGGDRDRGRFGGPGGDMRGGGPGRGGFGPGRGGFGPGMRGGPGSDGPGGPGFGGPGFGGPGFGGPGFGGPGFGGPGFGGPGFGGPGGGPSSFLARLDRNGNGMLDPDEIDGRMRGMVERMAEDADIDTSRPIPLGTITRAFERMREERMRSMGGESRGDDRDRGSSRSRSEPEYEPLVPGFGEPDLFDPVPGFGAMGERFAVKITDDDRQEATRTLSRNDGNNDGVLDAEEIRRGRWGDDPLSTDRNGDGKLTLNELALRYAMRRVAREGGGDSRSSRGSNRSSSRGSSDRRDSDSDDSDDRRNRMIEMIFGRYDRNGNGVIDGDEVGSMRGGGEQYDENGDGRITREEFSEALANRFGGRGRDGGRDSSFYTRRDGRGDDQGEGRSEGSSGDRKSYRSQSASERLAEIEDLPEWFARNDMNQDGQVQMSEYASSWSDAVVADFSQFDLNGDGIVTPAECLKATERGAVPGMASGGTSSSSGFSSRRSYATPSVPTRSTASSPVASETSESTTETTQEVAAGGGQGGPDPRYVKYAVGVIQRYDTDKDQMLSADEWKNADKDYSSADADGNGKITPVELAAFFTKR